MNHPESVEYRLFSVVYHHGKLAHGGHYTSDVFINDKWIRFDDDSYSDIEEEIVTSEQKDRQPYMLFYTRI